LNKVHPDIPTPSDYQPIVICNPIVKFLEGHVIGDLMRYLKNRMNRKQFGFIPTIGIENCKEALLQKLI